MRRLLIALCIWLLAGAPVWAQFNGQSGIYALNHMWFSIMAQNLTVATPGSGYATNDTVTLDCPDTNIFQTPHTTRPVVTWNGSSWTLTNPGVSTSIPSTGLAGGNNGTCVLTQFATSGTGSGVSFNATFGFNAASLNGSNSGGGGGGSGITIGTTTITGGVNGECIYDNSGVAGVITCGGGGGGSVTVYATHAALIAGTTTLGTGPIVQQGFTATGDGGQAVYQPNASSYCPGGSSGSPTAADGLTCILPSGQSASTAGRYLLQVSGEIDVRVVGMQPGGQDNSPYVAALLAAAGPVLNNGPGPVFVFPPLLGLNYTYWYFSSQLTASVGGQFDCRGHVSEQSGASVLVFAPGTNGVVQANTGGTGQTDISRCTITSLGGGTAANPTFGSSTINNVSLNGLLGGIFTFPSACTPVGGQCTFGVGDGVIMASQSAMMTAPGAYVSAVSGRTLTLASPYTILATAAAIPTRIFDLPVSQKYTIQTTTGSNSATVTAGPRPLEPGDMLWSDAFLFGATVLTVSNSTAFPQTITVFDVTMTSHANALVTHTGGSPGQMWIAPAGVERQVQGSLHQDAVTFFPFELRLSCSASTVPAGGCNGSFDQENSLQFGLIGRLTRGDNTGGSTIISNVYAQNALMDEVEAGTIGSTYVGEEDNSQDSGTSAYGTITFCTGTSATTYIGSYLSGQSPNAVCLGLDAQSNPSIVATPVNGQAALFLGPLFGSPPPSIVGGEMTGAWSFQGPSTATVVATTPTASGTVIAVPTTIQVQNGTKITDLTNAVIPVNTTIVSHAVNTVTLSNALTGGGILTNDIIQYSSDGVGNPSIHINGGIGANAGVSFDPNTSSLYNLLMQFDGYVGSWDFGAMRFGGLLYQGYNPGGVSNFIVLPGGATIGNNSEDFTGMERLLDGGSVQPTDPTHLQGDTRINSKPLPGGNLAWTDAASFSTSLTANVTAGVTTSVAVAACPSPSLPAGTPIVAYQNYQISGLVVLDQPLGTLSSCSGTTLTFQAAAAYNSLSSTVIRFLQWQKAGIIQDGIPSISSCGTGTPTVTAGSNNIGGQFTMGTGTPTACTILFAHAYPNVGFCTVTPVSSGGAAITGGYYLSTANNTGFVLTLGTGTSSLVFDYTCTGN
jgi:hypothetical protein